MTIRTKNVKIHRLSYVKDYGNIPYLVANSIISDSGAMIMPFYTSQQDADKLIRR
jgi:hypothetical protein